MKITRFFVVLTTFAVSIEHAQAVDWDSLLGGLRNRMRQIVSETHPAVSREDFLHDLREARSDEEVVQTIDDYFKSYPRRTYEMLTTLSDEELKIFHQSQARMNKVISSLARLQSQKLITLEEQTALNIRLALPYAQHMQRTLRAQANAKDQRTLALSERPPMRIQVHGGYEMEVYELKDYELTEQDHAVVIQVQFGFKGRTEYLRVPETMAIRDRDIEGELNIYAIEENALHPLARIEKQGFPKTRVATTVVDLVRFASAVEQDGVSYSPVRCANFLKDLAIRMKKKKD